MSDHPARPQTPQAMLHRLPDKPEASSTELSTKPSKYIILILASTAVAGKAQIAKSVADALGCPLFQGDSLHETAARAASVGVGMETAPRGDEEDTTAATGSTPSGANEGRYQRMWLSKMTRTGYLFPEESRPANEGFSGFGGGAPAPSSASAPSTSKYINKPPPTTTLSAEEKARRANPALMVVTHPVLEQWHKDSIRRVVGEYGIGIIFVPLDEDDELPVLKPLDPRTMTSFGSMGSFGNVQSLTASTSEIVLSVDVEAKVEDLTQDIVAGVRDLMSTSAADAA